VRLSEEFEPFFRESDAANASLPPTLSLPPGAATPLSPDQAARQMARRRHFTKLVKTIVAACMLLLAVALCLKAHNSRAALNKPQPNSSVPAALESPAAARGSLEASALATQPASGTALLPVAEVPVEASPPTKTSQLSASTNSKKWRPKRGATARHAKSKKAKTAPVAASRQKRKTAAKTPAKSASGR
jgi:hypothetical protein